MFKKNQLTAIILFTLVFNNSGFSQDFPPIDIDKLNLKDYTPPCNVSDNCIETDNYMPVWRWDATARQMNECPSPLYVRKDAYTCEKIQRKFGIIMGPLNPNDPSPWVQET